MKTNPTKAFQSALALASATMAISLAAAFVPASAQDTFDLTPFQERLAPFQQKPEFKAAGEPFDAKACMAGKSIFSIPVSSENTFTAAIEKEMQNIAKEVGFEFTTWENQGTSQQWAQGINAAITQGADLIDLLAAAPIRARWCRRFWPRVKPAFPSLPRTTVPRNSAKRC